MSGSFRILVGASHEPRIPLTHDTPELAATYEEVSIRQFENGEQLISALNISGGECVLDIGAGTGRLGAYVAKIVGPSGCVVGINPLPLRIEIAQSKGIGNFEARVEPKRLAGEGIRLERYLIFATARKPKGV